MSSGDSVIFCFLLLISHVAGLVKLPNVDDNNILHAEAVIRDTVNTLFSSLRLKDVKKKPRLKEFSTVHNHLISFTLQDYNNLKEIAKLTKVVKNETNVDINNFMTALNDLLNEDSTENTEFTLNSKEEILVNYIEDFLHQLEVLKYKHGVEHDDFRLKEDISRILKKGDSLFSNHTSPEANHNESVDQENLLDDEGFWKPGNISSGRRIFRGNRIKIKHFPFVVSVHIFNNFQCAGSIITADLIVTAASCLQIAYNNRLFRENPAFLSIRVGSDFYNGGEHISALEVYFHPLYSPKNLNNNICLIRLTRKLIFSKRKRNVKKIDFDKQASVLPAVTDGITVVGWGAQGTGTSVLNPWQNRLAFAVLDYYPLNDCQEIYSKDFVTKKNFCAGFFSKGGGACNRDVGGPGIVNGILAGIVSFGSPVCGSTNSPTVFTKLGYHTDWIETIMEQDIVPEKAARTTTPRAKLFTIPQFGQSINIFRITPPSGDISPIPIREIDTLRMLNRTDLFKEFIITMFNSKERKDYEDFLKPNLPDDDRQEKETTPLYKPTHKPLPVTPILSNIPTAIIDYDLKVPTNDIPGIYDVEGSSERNTIKPTKDVPEIGESLEKYTINPAKTEPGIYDIVGSSERNTIKPVQDDPELYDKGNSIEKYKLIPEKVDSELDNLEDSLERSTTKPAKDVPELYEIGDSIERNTFKPTHSVTENYDKGDSLERSTTKPVTDVPDVYDIGDSTERFFLTTRGFTGNHYIDDSFERETFMPSKPSRPSKPGKPYKPTKPYKHFKPFKPANNEDAVTVSYDIGDSSERFFLTTRGFTGNYYIDDSFERDTFMPSRPSKPSKPGKPSKPTKSYKHFKPVKLVNNEDPVTVSYDVGVSSERNTMKPLHISSNNGIKDSSIITPDEICSDETDVELIRMLDNIDVDKLIDNIANLDDSNMVVDPKILELFQNDDDDKKFSNIDESIMTLLYLTNTDKNLDKHHVKKQVNNMNEGMSISAVPFKDLTYRNNNTFDTRQWSV